MHLSEQHNNVEKVTLMLERNCQAEYKRASSSHLPNLDVLLGRNPSLLAELFRGSHERHSIEYHSKPSLEQTLRIHHRSGARRTTATTSSQTLVNTRTK